MIDDRRDEDRFDAWIASLEAMLRPAPRPSERPRDLPMVVASRALLRLASPGAVLAPVRAGESFAVFPKGDRRCRAVARLARGDARARSLMALQEIASGVFALSEAGDARVRREAAQRGEEFLAQHAPVVTRNSGRASWR